MQARARHFGRQFHNALRLHGGLAFGPEHTQMVAVHVGPLHLQLRKELLEVQHGQKVGQFLGEGTKTVAHGKRGLFPGSAAHG